MEKNKGVQPRHNISVLCDHFVTDKYQFHCLKLRQRPLRAKTGCLCQLNWPVLRDVLEVINPIQRAETNPFSAIVMCEDERTK